MNKELISKLKSILMHLPDPMMYPAVEFISTVLEANPKLRHQDRYNNELRSDYVEEFINDLQTRFGNLRNFEQKLIKITDTLEI